jgi:lambda family phage portal protein
MGVLSSIFGGGKLAEAQANVAALQSTVYGLLQAKFDAAQTTALNKNHWGLADHLSADAAVDPQTRRILRSRGRMEAQNNPYVAGISSTLATSLVGTGPRLRLDIPKSDPKDVQTVQRRFFDWMWDIDLPQKIRIMAQARVPDGDPFGVMFTNRQLRGVQLDLKLVESDQVADPWPRAETGAVDGAKFDDDGNIVAWHILHEHPGSGSIASVMGKGKWIPATEVIHWPHLTRPGQHRGFGRIVPALELFGALRRFVNATVTAAEVAASFSAILKTTLLPPNQAAAQLNGDFKKFPIAHGMMTNLPDGWDFQQFKAEHPNATFEEFVRWILGMACRACDIPIIAATMDATGANYSSMRGDYLIFRKYLDVDRSMVERIILDPLFTRWFEEAIFIRGQIPSGLPPFSEWNWSWAWDQLGHIDPVKEAAGEQIRLENHTETLARLYAARGMDWREEVDQAAVEKEYLLSKGLKLADVAPKTRDAVKAAIQKAITEEFQEGLAQAA